MSDIVERLDDWLDENGNEDEATGIREAETKKVVTDDGVIGEVAEEFRDFLLVERIYSAYVHENDDHIFVRFKPEKQTMPIALIDAAEFRNRIDGLGDILFEVGRPGITLRFRKEE